MPFAPGSRFNCGRRAGPQRPLLKSAFQTVMRLATSFHSPPGHLHGARITQRAGQLVYYDIDRKMDLDRTFPVVHVLTV